MEWNKYRIPNRTSGNIEIWIYEWRNAIQCLLTEWTDDAVPRQLHGTCIYWQPNPICMRNQIQMIENTSNRSFECLFWNLMSLVGDEQPGMSRDFFLHTINSIEWDSDERWANCVFLSISDEITIDTNYFLTSADVIACNTRAETLDCGCIGSLMETVRNDFIESIIIFAIAQFGWGIPHSRCPIHEKQREKHMFQLIHWFHCYRRANVFWSAVNSARALKIRFQTTIL